MAAYRQRDVQNPHFQVPFKIGGINGGAFVNEQDSVDDIVDCIKVIIAFPIGSRQDAPSFGIPDLLFRPITEQKIAQVKAAVVRWEDRAMIDVDGAPLLTDELVTKIIVKVGSSDA